MYRHEAIAIANKMMEQVGEQEKLKHWVVDAILQAANTPKQPDPLPVGWQVIAPNGEWDLMNAYRLRWLEGLGSLKDCKKIPVFSGSIPFGFSPFAWLIPGHPQDGILIQQTEPSNSERRPIICANEHIKDFQNAFNTILQGTCRPRRNCDADMYADPPRDCNAPFCGCDPAWSKCIEMLVEIGWKSPEELRPNEIIAWRGIDPDGNWTIVQADTKTNIEKNSIGIQFVWTPLYANLAEVEKRTTIAWRRRWLDGDVEAWEWYTYPDRPAGEDWQPVYA